MKKGDLPAAKRSAFLAAYAKCGNITGAARLAKVARSQHYEWLADPEYAAAFAAAHEEACELLESEARRRAVEGLQEPVFYKGGQCGSIRRYSDTLLIFLMKGAMPDKYRDNFKGEIKHSGMISRGPDLSKLTDEQLDQLEQLARAAAEPGRNRGGEGPPVEE